MIIIIFITPDQSHLLNIHIVTIDTKRYYDF